MSDRGFILEGEGLNRTFDGFKAISNLNFYMDTGELRTVIGPNGAGKTTFLDLITGRTKPDTGSITFAGEHELTRMNEYQIYRLGIGRKFQTPTVYVEHTVFDNLLLSLGGSRTVFSTIFSRITPAQRERIHEILKIIGLTHRTEALAGSLAHGQKQWLEIGMLLAQDAKLLLVDEPAAGMTDEETAKTGELLLSLAGKHSIIVIEHDMVFVRQIATKVTVLHQGTVLCEGTVDEVQNNEKVIEIYLGPESAYLIMLEIKSINVSISGSRILRETTFDVPDNQVLCLMGRNGVGKTTTLRSIMGLRRVESGSITLDGVDITKIKPEARVRAGIGYVPQGREIFPSLTVLENLQISQTARGKRSAERFDRVYTLFPVLKEMLHRKGGVLSGGQQQQLAIGRALLTEPKLLILDEPTEGIQPSIIDQIGDAILKLKGELSVLLVEQYLDFAKELADKFVIMDRGSIVARGEIAELHEGVVKQYLTV